MNINFSNLIQAFKAKNMSLEEAFALVPPQATVVTAMAAAEPTVLFENLHRLVPTKKHIDVFCANPGSPWKCFQDPALAEHLNLRIMFLTPDVRKLQGNRLVHYIPQHLSQWVPNLKRRGPIDVFWGSCTPPDEFGYVSLGLGACYEPEILRSADYVVLEINERMPYTFGSTRVRVDMVDAFVKGNPKLEVLNPAPVSALDRKVASHIAELVPDGATIQLGIGGIPNAVGEMLADKKDLGVHTEMITDSMWRLYEKGVLTGHRKSIWKDKIIGAFALGSVGLYSFIHKNPSVELHSAHVVNDPAKLGQNHKMHSINTAIQIDLTGQVCSESVGHREISGVGGASDTHVGAQRSPGGRGIVAVHARSAKGFPKIVPELLPGAKVSISRNDVDTVVTEYGIAELKGRCVEQRVKSLIAIAHPDDRAFLEEKALEFGYL